MYDISDEINHDRCKIYSEWFTIAHVRNRVRALIGLLLVGELLKILIFIKQPLLRSDKDATGLNGIRTTSTGVFQSQISYWNKTMD